jgi:virginiamycin B lyase
LVRRAQRERDRACDAERRGDRVHLPNPGSSPFWLVVGPDGGLWFTEISGNRIGRIAVDGSVTEFSVPTAASQPTGLAVGPDGISLVHTANASAAFAVHLI